MQRALKENPGFVFVHRLNVIALGCLGRMAEAKSAARSLLALAPGFTVSMFEPTAPIRDSDRRNRIAAIYSAAGVPS